jgi:hypothetical protein
MKKDVTFCFRTNKAILDLLRRTAMRQGRPMAAIVEEMINEYFKLGESQGAEGQTPERRETQRVDTSLPCEMLSCAGTEDNPLTGVVMNMSHGGLLVRYDLNGDEHMPTFNVSDKLCVSVRHPKTRKKIRLECIPKYVKVLKNAVLLGAAFEEGKAATSLKSILA